MAITMYDLLMDLPLLQGISREHVSALLEKTHIEFSKANAGDVLRRAGDEDNALMYVISGSVEAEWRNHADDIVITFSEKGRTLLDASHLFGMQRKNPYTYTAQTDVSLLSIDKSQYLSLLGTQSIYMLNFINYLSLRAQRPMELLAQIDSCRLRDFLTTWITTITPSTARNITLQADKSTLMKYTNQSEGSLIADLAEMQRQKVIKYSSDIIAIASRESLSDNFRP